MCAARLLPELQPISLDLSTAFDYERGVGRAELLALSSRLDEARARLASARADAQSLVPAWLQQCLDDYKRHRKSSQLGQILQSAKRLRDAVDRVVILGPPQTVSTARALFSACCHPYHNELSRGQRGGRPRIYFLPAAPDNDAVQAMLEILPRQQLLHTAHDRWGIVALDACAADGSQSSELIRGLFLHLWEALQSTTTADKETGLATLVGPPASPLLELAHNIGLEAISGPVACQRPNSTFFLDPGVLLAGSVMGVDIVNVLRGAAAVAERFATHPVGANPALDFAGLRYLLARRLRTLGLAIESSASALHRLAQGLHAGTGGDDLLVQWIVENHRHDRLHVSVTSGKTLEGRPKKLERSLAELAYEQTERVRKARMQAGQPTAVVRLPTIDEATIGQLIEMHALAAAVEQSLAGPRPEP